MVNIIHLEPKEIAEVLTDGARLALLGMTDDWAKSSTMTFNSNGAIFLHENYRGLCEKKYVKEKGRNRCLFRLSPLGSQVKKLL